MANQIIPKSAGQTEHRHPKPTVYTITEEEFKKFLDISCQLVALSEIVDHVETYSAVYLLLEPILKNFDSISPEEIEGEELTQPEAGEPAEFTLTVNVEDLQKIIEAADQIEALLSLLPDGSPVLSLLKPIDALFGKALYGPAELATAVLEASKREEKRGAE